jgi:hypothetical protein
MCLSVLLLAMHCQSMFSLLERGCIVNQCIFFLGKTIHGQHWKDLGQVWSFRIGGENKLVSLPVKMKVRWGDYRTSKSRRDQFTLVVFLHMVRIMSYCVWAHVHHSNFQGKLSVTSNLLWHVINPIQWTIDIYGAWSLPTRNAAIS